MTTAGVLVFTFALLAAGASLWWGWRMRWERDAARGETAGLRAPYTGMIVEPTSGAEAGQKREIVQYADDDVRRVPDDDAGPGWSRRR